MCPSKGTSNVQLIYFMCCYQSAELPVISDVMMLMWCHYNDLTMKHDRPWISLWIKSISNQLDITFHLIASQLSGHCDVISTRLWRHQENVDWASEPRRRCVKIFIFIIVYGFVMSCKKYDNLCTLVTNCLRAHSSVILVFISLVAAQLGK